MAVNVDVKKKSLENLSQDPSTEQRYQMEPPEQGQNYSVNIPLTTDVSHLLICENYNTMCRSSTPVRQLTSPTLCCILLHLLPRHQKTR